MIEEIIVGIIGGGGREGTLIRSFAALKNVKHVYSFPGTVDAELSDKCTRIDIDCDNPINFERLYHAVKVEDISHLVVGPEAPLYEGIADFFNKKGFTNIFAPTQKASEIERSKAFTCDLLKSIGISQAEYIICNDLDSTLGAIDMFNDRKKNVVLKAIWPKEGKGVTVYDSIQAAMLHAPRFLIDNGSDVVVAERLYGKEFSVFGFSDGENIIPIPFAIQDYKRLLDKDKGPNTGGMGGYGPVDFVTNEIIDYVANDIMTPVVRKLKEEGREYKGILYAGCMDTGGHNLKDRIKIIEFNCRLGDPEAQLLDPLLKYGLATPIIHAIKGDLKPEHLEYNNKYAVCVCLASEGYPSSNLITGNIMNLNVYQAMEKEGIRIIHAGTELDGEMIKSNSGRAMYVVADSEKGIGYAKAEADSVALNIQMLAAANNKNKKMLHFRKDIAK